MDNKEIKSQIYLSLIIPVFNGFSLLEQSLSKLTEYFKNKSFSYEIIVVDDGSKDVDLVKQLCVKYNIRFLYNKKNKGKGATLRMGFLASLGDYVIFTDTDLPYGTQIIEDFLKHLDFNKHDIVIGDRTLKESYYYSGISAARSLGSKIIAGIIGNLVTRGIPDTQCGIKGFRSAVAKRIFTISKINRFAIDIEIIYLGLKLNYDIKRIPVRLVCSQGITVRPFRDGLKILLDSLRIIYFSKSGEYDL